MANNQKARPKWLAVGILLTILVQLTVLAVEYLSSVAPLWFGNPVMLKTVPVDPRSLFRGNYVRLGYEISLIPAALANDKFKEGQKVYLSLVEKGQQLVPESLSARPPEQGLFIAGRVRHAGGGYRIEYGIEAFFLPKDKALTAQNKLTSDEVSAQVYISASGKAALNALYCNGKPCDLSQ